MQILTTSVLMLMGLKSGFKLSSTSSLAVKELTRHDWIFPWVSR